MTSRIQNNSLSNQGIHAGEETLRLVASLPAPDGIEERIKARLESAPQKSRVLLWPSSRESVSDWVRGKTIRAVAAAAIVFVVVGGGWGVYSRVRPAPQSNVIVMPPRINGAGGFSSAGAMRTPQSLDGPVVLHPANEAAAGGKTAQGGAAPAQKKRSRAPRTLSSKPAASPSHKHP
jgi:hypothetical protein